MNQQQIYSFLQQADLFKEMDPAILEHIAQVANYKTIKKDEVLVQENDIADSIYIITSGSFSVYRYPVAGDKTIYAHFTILQPGDTIGEIAFLDEQPRSANVMAIDDNCSVIEISNNKLKELAPISFYQKLAKKLSYNIRSSNEIIVRELGQELKQRKKLENMSRLITYVLLLMAFYDLALKGFMTLVTTSYNSIFASTSIITIFTIALICLVKNMGYPLKNYGLTLHNWKPALKESLFYTAIFIAAITLLKILIIKYIPMYQHTPLFNYESLIKIATPGTEKFYVWFFGGMFVYTIFVNLQEFVARGVLQSSLQNLLQQKHKYLIANVVTSGIFAAMHIHLASGLAFVTFVPSLFWGWLFIRHRTLLSPIVSHILIGWWAIFALGIEQLLR